MEHPLPVLTSRIPPLMTYFVVESVRLSLTQNCQMVGSCSRKWYALLMSLLIHIALGCWKGLDLGLNYFWETGKERGWMKNLFMQDLWGKSNCIKCSALHHLPLRLAGSRGRVCLKFCCYLQTSWTYYTPGPHKDMAGMCLQLSLSLNAPNPRLDRKSVV